MDSFHGIAEDLLAFNKVIVDQVPMSIYVIDLFGNYIFANNSFYLSTGYSEQEIKKINAFDLIMQEEAESLFYMVEEVKKDNEIMDVKITFKTKAGGLLNISSDITPLKNKKGEVVAILTVSYNMTDRYLIDEDLINSAKLESLGVLAGGLAHNFRNILLGIIGNVSLLQLDKGLTLMQQEGLDEIYKASIRATELTNQLSTFAKGGHPITKPESIIDIIRESSSFILAGSSSKCEIEVTNDIPPVEVDVSQISQLVSNIILNSDQAMPGGGIINVRLERTLITPYNNLPILGDFVVLTIVDEGLGIPEKIKDKIFDPYFTTRASGSGLGLASCYSIIKKHKGHIRFESVIGEGTTFFIYIPVSSQSIKSAEKVDIDLTHTMSGRVLIMDDDLDLLYTAERMLRKIGLDVVTTKNGYEAIDEFRKGIETGERFNLVILDVTVPGTLGGKDTMTKLMQLDPHVSAIISSGYSNEPILVNHQSYGFRDILKKPYEYRDLLITVQRNII